MVLLTGAVCGWFGELLVVATAELVSVVFVLSVVLAVFMLSVVLADVVLPPFGEVVCDDILEDTGAPGLSGPVDAIDTLLVRMLMAFEILTSP